MSTAKPTIHEPEVLVDATLSVAATYETAKAAQRDLDEEDPADADEAAAAILRNLKKP